MSLFIHQKNNSNGEFKNVAEIIRSAKTIIKSITYYTEASWKDPLIGLSGIEILKVTGVGQNKMRRTYILIYNHLIFS